MSLDPNLPNLSAAEIERLALLAEEMGEAIHMIGKVLRHGYMSSNPEIEHAQQNLILLEKELGDVMAALHLMQEAKDISLVTIGQWADLKRGRLTQWLRHQGGNAA